MRVWVSQLKRKHPNLYSYHSFRDWLRSRVNTSRLLLMVAMVLGIELRFRGLDRVSMSLDEGFTWAAVTVGHSQRSRRQVCSVYG